MLKTKRLIFHLHTDKHCTQARTADFTGIEIKQRKQTRPELHRREREAFRAAPPVTPHLRLLLVPVVLQARRSETLSQILTNNVSTAAPPTTTSISSFRKDPHHSTMSLWSLRPLIGCHAHMRPPNPPTSASFYDSSQGPIGTARVLQPEQNERPKLPSSRMAAVQICSKLFARLQNIWSCKPYISLW